MKTSMMEGMTGQELMSSIISLVPGAVMVLLDFGIYVNCACSPLGYE